MHIVRRERRWEGGRKPYLYLRETFRQDGKPRDRVCYLGPEEAEDIESRARKVLRKRGYTDAEVRAMIEALAEETEAPAGVSHG